MTLGRISRVGQNVVWPKMFMFLNVTHIVSLKRLLTVLDVITLISVTTVYAFMPEGYGKLTETVTYFFRFIQKSIFSDVLFSK